MLFALDCVEHFVLEEVDKIVRERWRIIERTTRYGWLTAGSQGRSIPREVSEVLAALAGKVGYEDCKEAFHRIRRVCRDLHPHCVPGIAIAVLDETYTAVIISRRGRESKCANTLLRDLPPTVFTISSDIYFNESRYTLPKNLPLITTKEKWEE